MGALGLGGMMFGGMALQQTALLYTSVANVAFLTAFYVPLVPLIAYLFLRRHVNFTVWPAVVLSIFGSFLLSGTSTVSAQLGDILTLGGAFFWAGHILLAQWLMTRVKTPFQLSFVQASVTACCAGLLMFGLEQPDIDDFMPVLPQILFAGVVSVGIGFTLQLVAQRYTSAPAAAFVCSRIWMGSSWRNTGTDRHDRLWANLFGDHHRRSGAGNPSDKDVATPIFRFLAQGLMTRFVRLCYKSRTECSGG
ncbi:MAG: DMT family transporter [Alphaproteobacteria bacterium]|nr:DMT family transporter [Alphaproteobacteria bacterium]